MGGKCEDKPLWNSGPLPLWFIFGKGFSLNSHLVQNTEFIPSRTQLGGMEKVIFLLCIPVLLEQWRLLKETFSSFLILVVFPRALFLILLFLGHLATSHDSPCWRLSKMTSPSSLLHLAACMISPLELSFPSLPLTPVFSLPFIIIKNKPKKPSSFLSN